MRILLTIILSVSLLAFPVMASPPYFAPDLLDVEKLQFDVDEGDSDHTPGLLEWNDTAGTLDIHTGVANVIMQVGQELVVKVVNKSAAKINNGQVVYVSGAQGNRPTVELAKADASLTADKTIGVATEDIAKNAEGFITINGLVRSIDTSSFTEGDMLYLSATTAGAITNVVPASPNHEVDLGFCLVSNANTGIILVEITTGRELDDAHDVFINSVANNDVIAWNSTSLLWENTADITLNSVSFEGADGGFFNATTEGGIGVVFSGTERIFIGDVRTYGTPTGAWQLRTVGSSASLPTYTHTGDLDTGRWRSAANTMEWIAGGVKVFNVTNTTALANNTIMTIEGGIGPYGELWWHDDDGIGTGTDIDIATTSAFVNVASANINLGAFSNTTLSAANGSITVDIGGLYKYNTSHSFTTSTGAAEIHHMGGVNGVVQKNCSGHRSITLGGGADVGNAGLSCLLELTAGDVVTTLVNSVANETVQYEAFNMNLTK